MNFNPSRKRDVHLTCFTKYFLKFDIILHFHILLKILIAHVLKKHNIIVTFTRQMGLLRQ